MGPPIRGRKIRDQTSNSPATRRGSCYLALLPHPRSTSAPPEVQLRTQSGDLVDVGSRILDGDAPAGESVHDTLARAERVFSTLRVRLGRWIGGDAFDALLERALARCRENHPVLGSVRWEPTREPKLTGLARADPSVTPAGLRTALIAILNELTAHLGRFIGDELAVRLVLHELEGPPGGSRGKS